MRDIRKRFRIPIYDVELVVIVTGDIPKAYKREFDFDIDDAQMACVGYHKRKFGLFLEPACKHRQEIIAHEIFHLTHRILEKCEMNFDSSHHEMGAYLCEHLTKTILNVLK